jgi:hypothetical protein
MKTYFTMPETISAMGMPEYKTIYLFEIIEYKFK